MTVPDGLVLSDRGDAGTLPKSAAKELDPSSAPAHTSRRNRDLPQRPAAVRRESALSWGAPTGSLSVLDAATAATTVAKSATGQQQD